MRRGLGSITKRGDFYHVDFTTTPYGSTVPLRYRESSGEVTPKGAAEYMARRMRELREPPPPAEQTLTLDGLAEFLLDDYGQRGHHSIRQATRAFTVLRGFFGADATVGQIRDRLPEFKAWALTKGRDGASFKPATVRRMLAVLGRASALAKEQHKLGSTLDVPSVTVNNARGGFFDESELRAILRHLPEYLRGPTVYAFWTGWRKSEVLGLRWAQVDRAARIVRLEPGTTKNKEGRTFPYGEVPELASLVAERWERTEALSRALGAIIPWVFCGDEGEPIRRMDRQWTAACDAAKVPGRLFHDLRRTAARNLLRAGVGTERAMKLMGHKTRAMFDRYAIVSEADLAEGAQLLGRLPGLNPAGIRQTGVTTNAQSIANTGSAGHFP